jgi:hypothetical protein
MFISFPIAFHFLPVDLTLHLDIVGPVATLLLVIKSLRLLYQVSCYRAITNIFVGAPAFSSMR